MEQAITQEQALVVLEQGYVKAEEVLKDKEKSDDLLERLEAKLKTIPKIGGKLSYIPTFVQLLKKYFSKEYTMVPIGTVIAITSALLYFINPLDLIPDAIPGIGYLDDAGVIAICLPLVKDDIDEFIKWRDLNKLVNVVE